MLQNNINISSMLQTPAKNNFFDSTKLKEEEPFFYGTEK